MGSVWVLGSAAWDLVYEVPQLPRAGTRTIGRWLGRRAGGSTGNIARALGSAGHRVSLHTQVGTDESGTALLNELATWGVRTGSVVRHGDCTPETLVFLDANADRTFIILRKDCAKLIPVPRDELIVADAVYIGHYGDFQRELPTFLRQSSALVVAAPPPLTATDWFAHIIIGSHTEYPESCLESPYTKLLGRVGPQLKWVIVTKGESGAVAHGPSGTVEILPVKAVVRDTTGAGDSFAAGAIHGLLRGQDLAVACRLGAYWAATALGLSQSAPPRWDQLGLGEPGTTAWTSMLDRLPEDD
jgi:sulfofructose kinase